MTQIIGALSEVSDRYSAVFCDLWGCLHDGKASFPAAVAALQSFRAKGGTVVLVTNSPRPKPSVMVQLDGLGIPRDCYDEVASSGDAAQYGLITGAVGRRVHHIGPPKDDVFFSTFAEDLVAVQKSEAAVTRVPLDQAEGLVVTGPLDDANDKPEDYRATFLYAKTKGLKLLCANPDITVHFGDQLLYCAGALAQLYDEMGGTSLYFGKPHPPIYDLARRRLAALKDRVPDDEILCIGDGIGTDVQGGMGEGLDTLFITSGLARDAFGTDLANPDKGLLGAWLAERQTDATFTIGALR